MTDNEIGLQLEAFVGTENGPLVAMELLQSKAFASVCMNKMDPSPNIDRSREWLLHVS
jgi:hypothetical protein